jgi:hypothetical protein
MLKKYFSVLSIFVLLATACFGQQSEVVFLEPQVAQQPQVEFKPVSAGREERTSINFGLMMGGGLIGGDLEFLLGKRIGLQVGAGLFGMDASFNYHFKPYINSSFVSLQYMQVGFGESNVAATFGPMFNFRAKKIFQAGIGWGAVVSKGPLWAEAYKQEVSMLLNFNVGLYFPL